MIDSDLAALYQVETFNLNKAVKRNATRFPKTSCFSFLGRKQKTEIPKWNLKLGRPPNATLRLYRQGVAMLSSVLRSDRAVQVNVSIIRTFVKLREILTTHEELARKVAQHDRQITALF